MKKRLLNIFALILFSSNVHAIQYTYDALSRLTKITYDNNSFISYQYDAAGNLLTVTVPQVSGDTTPPVISVSSGISIQLNQGNNVPVTDNRIVTFLGSVTAIDNVDGQISVNHNAPSSFGLGITNINFTASDTAGNSANATASITLSSLDGDSDNLPDAWEVRYGLNPLSANDALLDADKDGLSNIDEFRLGRNPVTNEPAVVMQSMSVLFSKGSNKHSGQLIHELIPVIVQP